MRFEIILQLNQDIINTCLTCGIIQQKLKNYGLSIDYAQQTVKFIEKEMGIKKGVALQFARYEGKDIEK